MEITIKENHVESIKWLLNKGMEITNSDKKHDIFADMLREIEMRNEGQ